MRGTLPRAANTEKRIADPFRLLRILGQTDTSNQRASLAVQRTRRPAPTLQPR